MTLRRAIALVSAVVLLVTGACGGDDDAGGNGDGLTDSGKFIPPEFSGDRDSSFCVDLRAGSDFDDPFAAGLSPDDVEARLAVATGNMRGLADQAPAELADDFDALLQGLDGLAAALRAVGYEPDRLTRSEAAAFDDESFVVAQLRIDAYRQQVCS